MAGDLMLYHEAFHYLGIPVTNDTATIKEAYRKLVPLHHPEVDPQGFMELHQAYKTALDHARRKGQTSITFTNTLWQPERPEPARDKTGYDSLFASLDEEITVDMAFQKAAFSRKISRLKLHWLPIPQRCWQKFFSSEAYLHCRGEEESFAMLFSLIIGRIHSYPVFRFLLAQLWELESWQSSEGHNALADKTRICIALLEEQYKHYLALNTTSWIASVWFPALWYYQAMPFLFKILVSTILFPLIVFGNGEALILLLLGFYILELIVWGVKAARKMGPYHPIVLEKKRKTHHKGKDDKGWAIVGAIYIVLIHMSVCLAIMEAIAG